MFPPLPAAGISATGPPMGMPAAPPAPAMCSGSFWSFALLRRKAVMPAAMAATRTRAPTAPATAPMTRVLLLPPPAAGGEGAVLALFSLPAPEPTGGGARCGLGLELGLGLALGVGALGGEGLGRGVTALPHAAQE